MSSTSLRADIALQIIDTIAIKTGYTVSKHNLVAALNHDSRCIITLGLWKCVGRGINFWKIDIDDDRVVLHGRSLTTFLLCDPNVFDSISELIINDDACRFSY